MDNQTHNSENDWVDSKLAKLVPPGDWYPDSKRAFAQFLKRRDRSEPGARPRWIRLSMAAAILASIGLVVTLLPWHALWKSGVEDKSKLISGPVKAATPAAVPTPASPAPKPPLRSQPPASAALPAVQQTAQLPPDQSHPPAAVAVAAIQQTVPPAAQQEQKPVEHVGPGVTPPRAISPMPEPDYTDEARQAHIQGTVVLGVIVRADGTGKVVNVTRGLDPGLDQKAIEAFEKWRFEPGKKDGKPVDVELQVVINFHLY